MNMDILTLLVTIFIIQQIIDIVTTLKALKSGCVETWIPTKWLMNKVGVKGALYLSKGLVIALVILMAVLFKEIVIVKYVMLGLIAFYTYILGNNLIQIRKQKQL